MLILLLGVMVLGRGVLSGQALAAGLAPPLAVRSYQTENSVRILWNSIADYAVAGYSIYRSTDGSTFTKVSDVPASSTSFTDSTAVQGGTYYYKVASTDAGGSESALSQLTATTVHYIQTATLYPGAATVAAIGDLNGDGKPDLAVGLYSPTAAGNGSQGKTYLQGKVDIYLGGSTKTTPSMTIVGQNAYDSFGAGLAITDLNKDGFDDLVVTAPMYGGVGKVYVYKGSARFSTTPVLTVTGSDPSDSLAGCSIASVGDVNGDGYNDIALGAPSGSTNYRGQVKVLLGGSTFAQRFLTYTGIEDNANLGTTVAAAGDVNGDGFPDILAATGVSEDNQKQNTVKLIYGGSSLVMAPPSFPRGFYGGGLAGLDFNGDGASDVIANMDEVGNLYLGAQSAGKPQLAYQQGAGELAPLGDLNKDGYADFVDGQSVFFGTGAPSELPVMRSAVSGAIGVGDLDKDGLKDVISCDGTSLNIRNFPSLRGLPEITVTLPAKNDISLSAASLTVQGKVTGSSSLLIAGQTVALAPDGSFQAAVPLKAGMNVIELIAKAADGRVAKRVLRVANNVPPLTIDISAPVHGAFATTAITVSGTVSDSTATVTVNDMPVPLVGTSFQTAVSASFPGTCKSITANAYDLYGQSATASVTAKIPLTGLLSGYLTDASTGAGIAGARVSVTSPLETKEMTTTTGGYYSTSLYSGTFDILFSKNGYAKQTATLDRYWLDYDNSYTLNAALTPAVPLVLVVSAPTERATVATSPVTVTGTVSNNAAVTINGIDTVVTAGSFSSPIAVSEGDNPIVVTATDSYGQTVSKTVLVTLSSKGNVSGWISDRSSNAGVPATLTLTDSAGVQRAAIADEFGDFAFTALQPGTFTLAVSATGYSTQTMAVTVTAGGTAVADVQLERVVPVISGVTVTEFTTTSATITWTTNQPATSSIEYGSTNSYGTAVSDNLMTTSHSLTLTDLQPGANYHYRVTSTNSYGFSSMTADAVLTAPVFTAKTIGEYDNVTVMEVTGNYDAKYADGTSNIVARMVIAREFFRTHDDIYDTLAIFSNFNYAMLDANTRGFYSAIKNDVQGIGVPVFDGSADFGSNSRLYGTTDMGDLALVGTGFGAAFDQAVLTLCHEQMHRFGSYVKFKKNDGTLSTALLGSDDAHWNYLLDTQGSVMYGNGWRDNNDGTFTSATVRNDFSPLDLYLMGMIDKTQVPPMLLIENQGVDPTQMPKLADVVTGTPRYVTIDDIIAAEGERIPSSAAAPKSFETAFILLVRPGSFTGSEIPRVEDLRRAYAGKFAQLTRGVGSIAGVAPSLSVAIDSPVAGTTVTSPNVTVTGSVINSTGVETGVVVNGVTASVSGNMFVANRVPVSLGANTISVVATDASGQSASAASEFTAADGPYVRLLANLDSGIAPLDVALRIEASFPIQDPFLYVVGPVPVQYPESGEYGYSISLSYEGSYRIVVSAVGPDGETYRDEVTVTVESARAIGSLLKKKWEAMKTAVFSGETATALDYFVPAARFRFNGIFSDPSTEIAQRLSEVKTLEVYTVKGRAAQAGAVKLEDGKEYAYPLHFVKDAYGIWRIFGF